MQRKFIAILAAAVVVLSLAMSAVAIVRADSSTVYYACVSGGAGMMYDVGTSAPTCHAGDSQISWNQQGPVGPAGPAGANGTNGVSGYEIVHNTMTVDTTINYDWYSFTVDCPVGKKIISGSWDLYWIYNGTQKVELPNTFNGGASDWIVHDSLVGSDGIEGDGWSVIVNGLAPSANEPTILQLTAVCITAS